MASRYWVGGTGTWDQSTTTHWASTSGGSSGVAVPTASDDVIFDTSSGTGTVTLSAATPCQSLSSTGTTLSTFTSAGYAMTIGGASPGPSNVALDASGFTTWTNATTITFASTSSTQVSIKTGGHSFGGVTFSGAGGNWALQSALTCTGQLIFDAGTFTSNSYNISCTNFITGTSDYPYIYLGTSTVTSSAAGGNSFLFNGQPTLVAQAATFVLSGASPGITTGSQSGSIKELGTVHFTGTGTMTFGGNFGVRMAALIAGAGQTLSFENGITYYIQSPTGWQVAGTGTGASLATVVSASVGNHFTLAIGPGVVSGNYLTIKDCYVVGGVKFYATNSTNVSGNSGITFRAPAFVLHGGPPRRANGSPPLPKVVTYPANTTTYGFPVPYIGVSTNNQSFDLSFPQRTQDNVTGFEDAVRARTNAFMFFNNMCDAQPTPLDGNPNRIVQAGKMPMLTFIPETSTGVYDLAGIIAGNHDSLIQNWATWMNGNAIIRFAHEMNISTIWGSSFGASNYVAMWQHVYTVWRAKETALGLPHCKWFWCANASTTFDAYYPGDAYCDIIGFDGYSEQVSSWLSPSVLYASASYGLADLEALGSGVKPIIIGEIGCSGYNNIRATWFTELFTLLAAYPRVKGFNYWWHNNEVTFDHYQFTVAERDENDDPLSAAAFQAGLAAWAPGVS